MPAKHQWTEAQDDLIRTQRGAGKSWSTIAYQLDLSRWFVIMHALHVLGLERTADQEPIEVIDPNRDPLPSGHPISWNAITAGFCIEGVEYGA